MSTEKVRGERGTRGREEIKERIDGSGQEQAGECDPSQSGDNSSKRAWRPVTSAGIIAVALVRLRFTHASTAGSCPAQCSASFSCLHSQSSPIALCLTSSSYSAHGISSHSEQRLRYAFMATPETLTATLTSVHWAARLGALAKMPLSSERAHNDTAAALVYLSFLQA